MQDVGGGGAEVRKDEAGGEGADGAGKEDGADAGLNHRGGVAGEIGGGPGRGGEVEGEEVEDCVGGEEEDSGADCYRGWCFGCGRVSWGV